MFIAATKLIQTPLCDEISECELTQTHGAPTNERSGKRNGTVDCVCIWIKAGNTVPDNQAIEFSFE
jgi:hypothetical protein